MKTRIGSTKLLAIAVALALFTSIWAVWGATSAKAIVIINSKTAMFTVTQGEAVRVYALNTGEAGMIVIGGRVADSENNTLMQFSAQRLAPGHATSFVFLPPDPIRPTAVRIELMVEGAPGTGAAVSFIPTVEVFDTATGKTNYGIYGWNPQPEPPRD